MIYEAQAPVNLALIKYWGKSCSTKQWPANDSLSITLANLYSKTKVVTSSYSDHKIFLNEQKIERGSLHGKKIFRFLDWLITQETNSKQKFIIKTKNNFPASCGLASSASGMAALSIAVIAALSKSKSLTQLEEKGYPLLKLSNLARMGSGSACRSFWGGFVCWKKMNSPKEQLAFSLKDENYWPLSHLVILVSDKAKKVTSSDGHNACWKSPFFLPRLEITSKRMEAMQAAIEKKDIHRFGELLELDCFDMHAIAMSSSPPIFYFREKTSKLLAWIRKTRLDCGINTYFTLDAGPNIHLLGEKKDIQKMKTYLKESFPNYEILESQIGSGPSLNAYQN